MTHEGARSTFNIQHLTLTQPTRYAVVEPGQKWEGPRVRFSTNNRLRVFTGLVETLEIVVPHKRV
jgi:hypothetical protein